MSALVHPNVSLIPSSPPPSPSRADLPDDVEPSPLLWAALGRPRNLVVTALVTLVAFALATFGSTALAACMGLFAPALYLCLITRSLGDPALTRQVHGALGPPLRYPVALADLQPPELRATYERLLRGHERLRRTLRAAPVAAATLADAYQGCGDLVQAAGKLALGSGQLHAQLERCGTQELLDEADDLATRSGSTGDAAAASAYRRAAVVRGHQLTTTRQLEHLRDRLAARLALAQAVVNSVTATAVKMDALEREARVNEVYRADP